MVSKPANQKADYRYYPKKGRKSNLHFRFCGLWACALVDSPKAMDLS
jgi:hypothetical protein